MNEDPMIPVPLSVIQALANYLGSKPYAEVHQGIAALGQAVEAADAELVESKGEDG